MAASQFDLDDDAVEFFVNGEFFSFHGRTP